MVFVLYDSTVKAVPAYAVNDNLRTEIIRREQFTPRGVLHLSVCESDYFRPCQRFSPEMLEQSSRIRREVVEQKLLKKASHAMTLGNACPMSAACPTSVTTCKPLLGGECKAEGAALFQPRRFESASVNVSRPS
eukprot:3333496-Amphidinium_carterae.1